MALFIIHEVSFRQPTSICFCSYRKVSVMVLWAFCPKSTLLIELYLFHEEFLWEVWAIKTLEREVKPWSNHKSNKMITLLFFVCLYSFMFHLLHALFFHWEKWNVHSLYQELCRWIWAFSKFLLFYVAFLLLAKASNYCPLSETLWRWILFFTNKSCL